jgi:hypothetical protein
MNAFPPVTDQRTAKESKPAGRKAHYDVQQLMDVWVYVQAGMKRARNRPCSGPVGGAGDTPRALRSR